MPSHAERVAAARAGSEETTHKSDDAFAELRGRLHHRLVEALGLALYDGSISDSELRHRALEVLEATIDQEQDQLTSTDRSDLINEIADAAVGFGPIDPLVNDPDITEIMVEGPSQVYYQKMGRHLKSEVRFVDQVHLRRIVNKLLRTVGRRVDDVTPMVDARLPDGSRVNAVIHPLAIGGPYLTIRKYLADPFQEDDLIAFGTMSQRVADFLRACVRGRLNLIISGARGSGKTTILNAVSFYISDRERIITIEDTAELQLTQERVLTLASRSANIEGERPVTISDLIKNALRMAPDRIVVGEVRDAAAFDMLQAMNTGRDGALTTVNSYSPRDTLSRIETMVLMAGLDLPARAVRELIASTVDLIVHVASFEDGSRRVTHVTEVGGVDDAIISLHDLFLFEYAKGVDDEGFFKGGLVATGIRPTLCDDLEMQGIPIPEDLFDSKPSPHSSG